VRNSRVLEFCTSTTGEPAPHRSGAVPQPAASPQAHGEEGRNNQSLVSGLQLPVFIAVGSFIHQHTRISLALNPHS